ncbi:WbqC family protein [Luteimonas sp. SMYT11W]|uniref:WbqC family protein n=1 Tax=Luteimonas flava TaxID=3115822 RepID=A0ABU7WJP4_9GAMM
MKLAIMQPYLFPYAGYFQLVASVDRFVFYDDVNYIKGGWINRNRLYMSGGVRWFTVHLQAASAHRKINQLHVAPDHFWRRKLLASVSDAYRKAPYFEQAYAMLADVIHSSDTSLSALARSSVIAVARYIGLQTEFVVSTERYGNEYLTGADRVLDICLREGAEEYHNLPGGTGLYAAEKFATSGVTLRFVQPALRPYSQFNRPFQPGLSALDLLMFNDRLSARRLMGKAVIDEQVAEILG